jgi:hypothetical protein
MRTAARTAVISGTATAASGRVARRQQQKFAAQTPQAGAPAAHSAAHDMVSCLQELAALRSAGALTDKEFAAAKAKLLSQ